MSEPGPGDHAIIVCAKPAHVLMGVVVAGSVHRACARCGADVWWAPSSDTMAKTLRGRGVLVERVCCCCAKAHTPEDYARLASETADGQVHTHHWADQDTPCSCGQTVQQFQQETGLGFDPGAPLRPPTV